ncbi:MAG: hypothetical protein Q4G03_09395 [Planctomycetia bacterium]|nr:hypothetical protein [Planctomycetia bacterium]
MTWFKRNAFSQGHLFSLLLLSSCLLLWPSIGYAQRNPGLGATGLPTPSVPSVAPTASPVPRDANPSAPASSSGNVAGSSGDIFLPNLVDGAPASFAASQAARSNRPPEPSKVRENLFYPDGFLTLSTPTPDPDDASAKPLERNKDARDSVKSPKAEKKTTPIRPLDPSVETTPFVAPQPLDDSVNSKRRRSDRFFFFALSIALAGLGLFVYYDYIYREQLRSVLVRNAKLRSPNAVGADFDQVFGGDLEMTDPLAPSFIDPTFDPDDFLYRDPSATHLATSLDALDEEHFQAQGGFQGSDLNEQNFDFVPTGRPYDPTEEVLEDFVVGNVGTSLPEVTN